MSVHRVRERLLELGLAGCALASVATPIVLVVMLVLGAVLAPADAGTSIVGLLLGTLKVMVIAVAVAVSLGVFAGIHLSEFADSSQRRVLEPLLEALAGVPTVVYGLLALVFVTPPLQLLLPDLADQNAVSAGFVLGVMIVPTLAIRCADALRAVPRQLREGAWALGAGEAQTLSTIVVPAATPGIFAAILLACSRAFGEAMIVLIAAGSVTGAGAQASLNPLLPTQTLATHILGHSYGQLFASERGRSLFIAALALLLVSIIINLVARRLLRRANAVVGGQPQLGPPEHAGRRVNSTSSLAPIDRRLRSLCRAALALPIIVVGLWLLGLFVVALPAVSEVMLMVGPLLTTLALALLTASLAIPAGIGAAIYLEEYGLRGRLGRLIEFNIAQLAGLPPVLYGLLGLQLFVVTLALGRGWLVCAATLALMILPLVTEGARAALREVPSSHREAALALGASRWQVIRRVVLPHARPGMVASSLLAMVRAIGEATPLLVIGVLAVNGVWFEGCRIREYDIPALPMTLPLAVFDTHTLHVGLPAAYALLLLLLSLGLSSWATLIRVRRGAHTQLRREALR